MCLCSASLVLEHERQRIDLLVFVAVLGKLPFLICGPVFDPSPLAQDVLPPDNNKGCKSVTMIPNMAECYRDSTRSERSARGELGDLKLMNELTFYLLLAGQRCGP